MCHIPEGEWSRSRNVCHAEGHHIIFGEIVVPGATYLEMALAVGVVHFNGKDKLWKVRKAPGPKRCHSLLGVRRASYSYISNMLNMGLSMRHICAI